MSKDKGRKYENELAALLNERGLPSERIPLSGSLGGSYSGDVRTNLGGYRLRWEVKYRSALKQSGVGRLVEHWRRQGESPLLLQGRYAVYPSLDDWIAQAALTPSALTLSTGALKWLAQSKDGALAIRLPQRLWRPRWIVVIDVLSAASWTTKPSTSSPPTFTPTPSTTA